MSRGAALFTTLLATEPIEWNRFGVFQDVTLRLVAERLLPPVLELSYSERKPIEWIDGGSDADEMRVAELRFEVLAATSSGGHKFKVRGLTIRPTAPPSQRARGSGDRTGEGD